MDLLLGGIPGFRLHLSARAQSPQTQILERKKNKEKYSVSRGTLNSLTACRTEHLLYVEPFLLYSTFASQHGGVGRWFQMGGPLIAMGEIASVLLMALYLNGTVGSSGWFVRWISDPRSPQVQIKRFRIQSPSRHIEMFFFVNDAYIPQFPPNFIVVWEYDSDTNQFGENLKVCEGSYASGEVYPLQSSSRWCMLILPNGNCKYKATPMSGLKMSLMLLSMQADYASTSLVLFCQWKAWQMAYYLWIIKFQNKRSYILLAEILPSTMKEMQSMLLLSAPHRFRSWPKSQNVCRIPLIMIAGAKYLYSLIRLPMRIALTPDFAPPKPKTQCHRKARRETSIGKHDSISATAGALSKWFFHSSRLYQGASRCDKSSNKHFTFTAHKLPSNSHPKRW